jgi:DnaJ family protein A protein 3
MDSYHLSGMSLSSKKEIKEIYAYKVLIRVFMELCQRYKRLVIFQIQRKRVTVPVPAGVEDGQTVRMATGNKELFITFRVEKSNYFRRDGADIHTNADISISQAILGGSIRVEGVYDHITVQIRPNTSSHTLIRLGGKGMKKTHTIGYGDHYVHIKIKVSTSLSEKQRALIQAYAELEDDTPGQVHGVTNKKDGKEHTQNS